MSAHIHTHTHTNHLISLGVSVQPTHWMALCAQRASATGLLIPDQKPPQCSCKYSSRVLFHVCGYHRDCCSLISVVGLSLQCSFKVSVVSYYRFVVLYDIWFLCGVFLIHSSCSMLNKKKLFCSICSILQRWMFRSHPGLIVALSAQRPCIGKLYFYFRVFKKPTEVQVQSGLKGGAVKRGQWSDLLTHLPFGIF